MSESTKMVVEVFVDAMIGDVEEAPALACLVQRREGGGQHWLRDVQHRELQRSLLRHRHHPVKKGAKAGKEREIQNKQEGNLGLTNIYANNLYITLVAKVKFYFSYLITFCQFMHMLIWVL